MMLSAFAGERFGSNKDISGSPKKSAAAHVSSIVQSALLCNLDAMDCGDIPIALARSLFMEPVLASNIRTFMATMSCLRIVALGITFTVVIRLFYYG